MINIVVNRNGTPTTWTLQENGEDLGYKGTGYLTGEPPSVRRMVREALRRGGYPGAAERVLDDSPVIFESSLPMLNICSTKKCLSFALSGSKVCPSCLRTEECLNFLVFGFYPNTKSTNPITHDKTLF